MSFKNPYSLFFNTGVQGDATSKDQDKKVRIVNVLIIFWYHAFVLMSVLAVIFREDYGPSLTLNAFGFLFLVLCHFLNKYRKYTFASMGVLGYTMFHYFMITNFFAPERFVEFFYLIVPAGSLIFFRKEFYSWLILVIALILFHFPFYYLDAYQSEGVLFLPPIMIFLFLLNFMVVLYFKKLNTKNEELLAEEKKKVELDKELIENQHKALEELSRFKDKFFINLSHEIRTPLTLIHGNVNQIESDDNKEETIKSLKYNIASITKLVDDVIDLAKIEEQGLSLQPVTVPVDFCLTKQYNMFKDVFKQKNINFTLGLADEEISIKVDKIYFERAIGNILNNAHKYTPENGNVSLSASLSQDKVEIKIIDDGIGIPEEMIDKIFNRFEQVDNDINKTGGSGIGLSFTQQVIQAHNATINVTSKEGAGTVFTIVLDVVENSIEEEVVAFHLPEENESKTIFIVDDNKEICEYLKKVFKDDNCHLFSDGLKVLEAIPLYNPACIISDYMMPNMNGYELVKNIREQGYKIPTVILTATTDEKTKLDILRLGVDDYLTKPFNEEELKLKVRHLIYNYSQRIEFAKTVDDLSLEAFNDNEFLNQLNGVMIDNIQNPKFNTDDMAYAMSISSSTLRRKVKLLTGMSTKQYSLSLKMQQARLYIEENSSASLKEVAFSIGITNQSRFANQYEEYFGKRP